MAKGDAQTAKPVTLRDVAAHCGLSVYPVSRVLSGKPGVTEETAAKIRQAAREIGYRPEANAVARRLAAMKSGESEANQVIAVTMPGHLGTVRFFSELFRGIAEEVTEHNFGLFMVPSYDPVAHEGLPIHLPPSIWRGEVDGLIMHHGLSDELRQQLRSSQGFGRRPIVSLAPGSQDRPEDVSLVQRDLRKGAALALTHLLTLGHRRVFLLQRPGEFGGASPQMAGYRDACVAAGLSVEQVLARIEIVRDHDLDEPLREALRRHPDVTALMARNDPNALEAAYALERLGVRIPQQMSLVGWDDTDPWPDAAGENRLTSVAFDLAEMGREAARLCIARARDPELPATVVTLPAGLAARRSTAAPAG